MKISSILLILFLITTSPISSQISSIDTVECSVPCSTLKKALQIKYRADYLDSQIVIVRDSIGYYRDIISSMDTMVQYKDSQIVVLRDSENQFKEQIKVKDDQVQAALKKARIGFITAGVTFLFSLLILI